MYRTAIDIVEPSRESLIKVLNERLADMVDLFNQTKYAHWNVKGPNFQQFPELFDNVAERVEESCDLLAERVVTLGGTAAGTTRQSATHSSIGKYDLGAVEGAQHVESLVRQIAKVAASVRKAIKQTDGFQEPTTADFFTAGEFTEHVGFLRDH